MIQTKQLHFSILRHFLQWLRLSQPHPGSLAEVQAKKISTRIKCPRWVLLEKASCFLSLVISYYVHMGPLAWQRTEMILESKLVGWPAVGCHTLFLSSCCFWEWPARHHSLIGPWPANASHPVQGSEVAAIPNDSTRCRTMCTPHPVRLQGNSKTRS